MTKNSRQDELYSPVPKTMVSVLSGSLFLCVLFSVLHGRHGQGWMLSCAITFGIIAYHIAIRFLSPVLLTFVFHKQYDCESRWFRQKSWEPGLYKVLKVKRWKGKALTYDPREFSIKLHAPDEIVNNMCHAELVHELIVALSFTSLLFAIPFGSFLVFLITAVLAAMFDMVFVILQRFNRPRVMKLMRRKR